MRSRAALPAFFVLLVLAPTRAGAEAQWWGQVQEGEGKLTLVLTVRGAACGKVGSIARTGGDGQEVSLFTSTDEVILETEDAQIDCACEPIGTEFGTGSKSCPERTCGKDDQCICTKLCVGVEDPCPPVGGLTYAVADRDGMPLLEVAHNLAAEPAGCKDEPLLTIEEEETGGGGGGGCSAVPGPLPRAGLLPWAAAIALAAVWFRRRRRGLLLLVVAAALAVPAAAGCSAEKKDETGEKDDKAAKDGPGLKPIDVDFEGTPWERVVTLQTELLDIFEVGSDEREVVREARRFRDREGERFAEHCRKALALYAEKPEKRMGYVAKAGRVWQVVEKRVRQVTAGWGPGNKREAKIVVNSFECR